MTDYFKISVVLNPVFPLQDILPQELADYGYDTFEETDTGFHAYIPAQSFSEQTLKEVFNNFLHAGKIEWKKQLIKGENWNKVWESSFQPVIVPGKFAICASFHEPPASVPFIIWVQPQMAFGTGHHPTTFLMASHLIDIDCTNLQVLDMGCGTGILSVIAEKKGAAAILAVDNEEAAVDNTLSNLTLNSSLKVTVEKGSAERLNNRHFNLILANINRNVLWEHIPVYAEVLNKGGNLWLSGFYSSDVPVLRKRVESFGFNVTALDAKDDWQLMKCVKV